MRDCSSFVPDGDEAKRLIVRLLGRELHAFGVHCT
jgi:hypothetical protein